jgi:ribosome maturation factor RimP
MDNPRTERPRLDAQDEAHETVPAAGPDRLLERVVEPVVATLGYELVAVRWAGSGRRGLQVFIDHPDGVTVDDCARVSRVVSTALDAAEQAPDAGALAKLLAAPYTLEVSSPGIERPLCRRSHFERFSGHVASVRTIAPLQPGESRRSFQGRIVSVEPDPNHPTDDHAGVVVLSTDDDAGMFRIPLAQMRRASLVDRR